MGLKLAALGTGAGWVIHRKQLCSEHASERREAAAHVEEAAWDLIMEVNLKSVVLPCKHVLPVMREQRSGAITNVSSIAAVSTFS